MSEKMFNTRIIHKHDTAENWEKATGFIPKIGELIVYDPDENFSYARTKMGDGLTGVNDLPFIQVQSDWNQNDENALDYVKNRTHYTGTTTVEIIPECQPIYDDLDGIFTINDTLTESSKSDIIEGKTYLINWNGTEYISIARSVIAYDTIYIGIGNLAEFGQADTGEPLWILRASEAEASIGVHSMIRPLDGSTTCTVSVAELVEEIHKLDEKYLPDSAINIQSDWNQNDETQPDYIKNRTHYTERTTILENWDGSTDGYETVTQDGEIVAIYLLDKSEFELDGSISYTYGIIEDSSYDVESTLTMETIGLMTTGLYLSEMYCLAVALEDNITFNGMTFEKAGLYAMIEGYYGTRAKSVFKTEYIKIDEKYLPDSAINVQPDWNQNDETASDFIKNKPDIATDEDAMDLLAELGAVEPVTTSDGSILTSSTGEIYTI